MTTTKPQNPDELYALLGDAPRLTTGGYSGLGYQDPESLRSRIRDTVLEQLRHIDPAQTFYLIHGGTVDGGICDATQEVGEKLKAQGFNIKTVGIYSETAEKSNTPIHAGLDVSLSVKPQEEGSWEVKDNSGHSVMVMASRGGKMAYFGGGGVSKAEVFEAMELETEAVGAGVPVEFRNMGPNPRKLAKKVGLDLPTDATARTVEEALISTAQNEPAKLDKQTPLRKVGSGPLKKAVFAPGAPAGA